MPSVVAVEVAEAAAGTAAVKECSGRGTCDVETGLCYCFSGWYSSNGTGWPGSRGDCGLYDIIGLRDGA
jgi:hypothetical protein